MPGDYLGTKDAPHARLHTEANASHIRVALKDDNLGLGAKRGSSQSEGQCTGLDAFQGLLGRLNGKNEGDLEKEQKSRDDLKRAVYTESRWGSVRFMSGGLLVGDKIQQLADDEAKTLQSSLLIKSDGQAGISLHSKRVVEGAKKMALESRPVNQLDKTKSSKSARRRSSLDAEDSDRPIPGSIGRPEACGRDEGQNYIRSPAETQPLHVALESPRPKQSDPDRSQRKAERKRRKHERELRRAAKKSQRAQEANRNTDEGAQKLAHVPRMDGSLVILPSLPQPDTARPRSQSIAVGGRHAVRQRYIQHKKMATMDSKALNEASRTCTIFKAPTG